MKAIIISDKPRWCALMMNGDKTIEVRKNKALVGAIQKLIDEYGYAEIYVYCSKNHYLGFISNRYIGKVVFKFRCYKVEEIESRKYSVNQFPYTESLVDDELLTESCLTTKEFDDYLGYDKNGYAIHISDLEIFKPRDLGEFYTTSLDKDVIKLFDNSIQLKNGTWVKPLTKAPQNFCYVEVE